MALGVAKPARVDFDSGFAAVSVPVSVSDQSASVPPMHVSVGHSACSFRSSHEQQLRGIDSRSAAVAAVVVTSVAVEHLEVV